MWPPPARPGRIASGSATFFSKTPAHTTHGSSTGADTRPHSCLRRGADRQGARQNPGNLYELDYAAHFRHVWEQALPADTNALIYEYGRVEQPAKQWFNGNDHPQYGKFERFETQPNAPEALRDLLQEERRSREQLSPGDFKRI